MFGPASRVLSAARRVREIDAWSVEDPGKLASESVVRQRRSVAMNGRDGRKRARSGTLVARGRMAVHSVRHATRPCDRRAIWSLGRRFGLLEVARMGDAVGERYWTNRIGSTPSRVEVTWDDAGQEMTRAIGSAAGNRGDGRVWHLGLV